MEENKSFIRAHLHILYFHYTRVLLDFRMLTKQRSHAIKTETCSIKYK